MFSSKKRGGSEKIRVNYRVLIGASVIVAFIAVWSISQPENVSRVLGQLVQWIVGWFGSFYVLLATTTLIFVLGLAASRFGKTRLGPSNSRPEFSTFSWASMLFAAGIGTDIMFFAVAEPISHYMLPPAGDPQSVHAAREAITWTLFHYGVTGWGMYALMGIALGYFAYRRGKPLAVRSALFPIFGRKVHGVLGDTVDIAAILGTIFGVCATLGIGVTQLSVGLEVLFGIPQGLPTHIGLVALAVVVATLSAVSGVNRGIRFLSQLNVALAVFLAGWVLIAGKTEFFLNAIAMNIGDFASTFLGRTLNTFAYSDRTEWMSTWTLFFWAWWVAWASFVGMFLARISRGRTLREFVVGTMIIPFLYVLMWIGIFGNAALDQVRSGHLDFAQLTLDTPERGFYALLAQYPGASFLIALATLVGLLFYVTSADSGALVMSNLSSYLPTARDDGERWVKILWATMTGILTISMLVVNGISALQDATIVSGLPFAFVIVLVMIGLVRALHDDEQAKSSREQSARNIIAGAGATSELASASWQDRVSRIFDTVSLTQAVSYVDRVVEPSLRAVVGRLSEEGIPATIIRGPAHEGEDAIPDLCIYDEVRVTVDTQGETFEYRIIAVEGQVPAYGGSFALGQETTIRLEVRVQHGDQDYDIMGYSKDAVIHDFLDHFDRYQEYLRLRHDTLDT
ncbi:MAG: high-affinity choline transporter BetT [Actinobacteria bacterium]|nr:MAG: high-affinity choline transporter BetT [Actinomycetota bacterium]